MSRAPIPASLRDPKKSKTSIVNNKTRRAIEDKLRGSNPKLTPPKWMTKEGKKEYRKFVKIYRDLDTNILSDLDVPTLAQYCEALVIYQEALETYNLYHHEDDLKTMERQSKLMSSLSGDLCITPVARARMGILTVKRESQRHEDRKGALAAMKETD